ncbi:MAG: non-canonical purine NTP pyrophosphatase [Alphaproteobacteria bacterium]|nr:non-canonical purine NTP pyrophosphatase [Alphaproteobacteria bacterium]
MVLATSNSGKIAEFMILLQPLKRHFIPAKDVGVALPVELTAAEGGTLAGNARLKAETLAQATGHWALADDSGLFVAALPHLLGVDTATYAGPDELLNTFAALPPQTPRTAAFHCVLALARPNQPTLVVEGVDRGMVAPVRSGYGGFGYDSIFIGENHHLTNAVRLERGEPAAQVKQHRQLAVSALLAALKIAA